MPAALPPPPTNADECRKLLAAEICKQKPDTTKVKGFQTLLASFEAQDLRTATTITKAAEDALREKEAAASLQASEQWRAAQITAIRAELQDELRSQQTLQVFEDKQRQTRQQTEITRLQEKTAALQQANTDQRAEITELQSKLIQAKEHIQTLRADNTSLAVQLAPVDPAVLQTELTELDAAKKTLQTLPERLKDATRALLLHTQLMRIAQGERIRQFEFDLMTKKSEWSLL